MQRSEFIEKVKMASEMMFTIGDIGFTVSEEDEGISIAQWNRQETQKRFKDAESLANEYMVNGKPIGEQTREITETFYTGYFE